MRPSHATTDTFDRASRVYHIGKTVTGLDRAVRFYSKTLGLDVLDPFTVSDEAFSTGVSVDDATDAFAHFDAELARIEFVEA